MSVAILALFLVPLLSLEAQAQPADPAQPQAVQWSFFDFDGNIVNTRPHLGGTFTTWHRLYLVRDRSDFLLAPAASATEPDHIDISTGDFHRLEPFFAKSDSLLGPLGRRATLEDGRTIQPGRYTVRIPDTFQFFRESPDPSRNGLLEDFKQAEAAAAAKGPPATFKGPAWDLFVSWCSDPESARSTRILTARGHSKAETDAFNAYLIEKGYIRFAPTWVAISRPEFDRLGPPGDIATRKSNYIREGLIALERLPRPQNGQSHLLVVSEDTQTNVDRIADVLSDAAQRHNTELRAVLFNSGLSTEVRQSSRPRIAEITSHSKTYRSRSLEQMLPTGRLFVGSEQSELAHKLNSLPNCSLSFGGR